MSRQLDELFIEITNHCLQSCIHCSSCAACQGYPEIDFNTFKSLINSCLPMGLQRVTLSGGEPFLHPEFFKFIDYLTTNKIHFSVYSCGVVLGEHKSVVPIPLSYMERLNNECFDKIVFSLHAGTEKTQTLITRYKNSLSYVLKSIDNAISKHMPVEIHTVPMQMNFSELEDILRIAVEHNVDCVSFLRFVPQGRGTDSMALIKSQLLEMRNLYSKWKNGYNGVKVRFGTPFNCISLQGLKCGAGYNKVLINAYGEILPCEAFKYMHNQRPTIYNSNIRNVWENDTLLNKLRNLDLNDVRNCQKCLERDKCLGGCPGQRIHQNGDLLKGPDTICLQVI